MYYDFMTKYTEIFCLKSERSFCTAKASHSFPTKNIGMSEKLTYEKFNETLTNEVVSFEQPGPVFQGSLHKAVEASQNDAAEISVSDSQYYTWHTST